MWSSTSRTEVDAKFGKALKEELYLHPSERVLGVWYVPAYSRAHPRKGAGAMPHARIHTYIPGVCCVHASLYAPRPQITAYVWFALLVQQTYTSLLQLPSLVTHTTPCIHHNGMGGRSIQ